MACASDLASEDTQALLEQLMSESPTSEKALEEAAAMDAAADQFQVCLCYQEYMQQRSKEAAWQEPHFVCGVTGPLIKVDMTPSPLHMLFDRDKFACRPLYVGCSLRRAQQGLAPLQQLRPSNP